jgi:ATP-binding cassette, subfamily B, bacterial
MNSAPTNRQSPPLTWGERLAALRNIPPLLRMIWETNPTLTLCTLLLRFVFAFIPVSTLWISKLIINLVVRAIRHQAFAPGTVWKLLTIEMLLVVASGTLSRLITLVDSLLGDQFTNHMSLKLMKHATASDLASFEDPEFNDKMERARRQATARLGMLASLAGMGRQALTLISLVSVVALFSPWLLPLLFVGTIPVFLTEAKFALLNYSILFRQTPQRRELDYLRYLGTSNASAKEVKIFGLGDYLSARLSVLFERFYSENKTLASQRAAQGALINLIPTVTYYVAYAFILLRALTGLISVGDLTYVGGAFSRAGDIMENLVSGLVDVSEQALYVKDLFDYFEKQPTIISRHNALAGPSRIRMGYEFRNVSFSYPGSDHNVLSDINLCLRPGERLALVGENGAGKTTLVKLLARLYDPTDGQILLDGKDLRDYEVEDLRRLMGVIFQDYVRYEMLVSENIGFGWIDALADQQRIETAAEKSLASNLVATFPNHYSQMLGRRFEGGIDLSSGQWQKIALARAYMRNAQVLILDEPTANLDARAEFQAYQRFVDLTQGKMAILISHRFSTVRMADRIIMLEQGRIVEQGTHTELLAFGSKYAELFELQAAGYR